MDTLPVQSIGRGVQAGEIEVIRLNRRLIPLYQGLDAVNIRNAACGDRSGVAAIKVRLFNDSVSGGTSTPVDFAIRFVDCN